MQHAAGPWQPPFSLPDMLLVLCDPAGRIQALCGAATLIDQAAQAGLDHGVSLTDSAMLFESATARPVLCDGQVVGWASVWWPVQQPVAAALAALGLELAAALVREHRATTERRWMGQILAMRYQGRVGHGIMDGSGRVLYASPAFWRLLGISQTPDLSQDMPFLWERVQRSLAQSESAPVTFRPPAVPNACRVQVEPMADQPQHSMLTVELLSALPSVRQKRNPLAARYRFADIVSVSANMHDALRVARSAAGSEVPVLLLGESGTGKELVAQAIHQQSARAAGPFVAVNCAALPRDLIASELFGYEEGAFTGARRQGAPGRFEQAHGGTLFLDELAEMAPEQQAMLLRVLEDGYVVRLGGGRPRPVDVRILAATNHDLSRAITEGTFRADLYYRLSIVAIELPPLRERPADIVALAEVFLEREADRTGRSIAWEPAALEALQRHSWPGNIRELYNVVKRAVILSGQERLGPEALPPEISRIKPSKRRRRKRVSEVQTALKETENVSEAARTLGVARSTIYRIRKREGLT